MCACVSGTTLAAHSCVHCFYIETRGSRRSHFYDTAYENGDLEIIKMRIWAPQFRRSPYFTQGTAGNLAV